MTRVLVVNTGSSSLKWTVFGPGEEVLAEADAPWRASEVAARAGELRAALAAAPPFDAAGHRVVHGGATFHTPVVVDEKVRAELERLLDLDPEHMPLALAGIDAVAAVAPERPQIAAFDTAFHVTLPEAAAGDALPREWSERFGLRRFGFHGLSVAWAVERAREMLGATPARLVVAHLGAGCSVTAVDHGRSADTSMGFSPLEGLMMATRSGSVDPGLLLHLEERCGIGVAELRDALTHRSGLAGVSGISGDLRQVLAAADAGSARARLAYERFVLSVRRALGAAAGVLGGLDAVVFTGGMGENSARLRGDSSRALAFAGLELEERADSGGAEDREISRPGSRVRALVVRAREDLVVRREVLRVLGTAPRGAGAAR